MGRRCHRGYTATKLEPAFASIPNLTGGVSATLAPFLSQHGRGTAGGHSHEGRKKTVAGVHLNNLITMNTVGEPIPISVNIKGQNQKVCPM